MRRRINIQTASFEELEMQCCEVVGTPYGHNMITIICQEAEKRFGAKKAEYLFNTYQG